MLLEVKPENPPCSTCKANCCQFVPMEKHELAALQACRPRKMLPGKVRSLDGDRLIIIGKCPWVAKDHSCSAYGSRPIICQMMGSEKMPCEKMPGGKETFEKLLRKHNPERRNGKQGS